jgi:iron only hydrogenase large subunit-like protein
VSACPGFVCYAEKTQGSYIIPHLSTVKSPLLITGSLVKNFLAEKIGINKECVYHVSVMPCYDKKLEATRPDFYDPVNSSRDVDCVLTTEELQKLMGYYKVDLTVLPPASVDCFSDFASDAASHPKAHRFMKHEGGGSGGFCDFVLKYASQKLFGLAVNEVKMVALRNKDFRECLLQSDDGKVLLRFAVAYGFRNIQTILQRIKRNRCEYDFVEIMACPFGCLNGGGQLRHQSLDAVNDAYERLPSISPLEMHSALQLLDDWKSFQGSKAMNRMLHTQYSSLEGRDDALRAVQW